MPESLLKKKSKAHKREENTHSDPGSVVDRGAPREEGGHEEHGDAEHCKEYQQEVHSLVL